MEFWSAARDRRFAIFPFRVRREKENTTAAIPRRTPEYRGRFGVLYRISLSFAPAVRYDLKGHPDNSNGVPRDAFPHDPMRRLPCRRHGLGCRLVQRRQDYLARA